MLNVFGAACNRVINKLADSQESSTPVESTPTPR